MTAYISELKRNARSMTVYDGAYSLLVCVFGLVRTSLQDAGRSATVVRILGSYFFQQGDSLRINQIMGSRPIRHVGNRVASTGLNFLARPVAGAKNFVGSGFHVG